MKYLGAPAILLLIVIAHPAHAQRADAKAEGARLDAAIIAGGAQAYAIAGPRTVTKAITSGCSTHLISGKEDWEIDWSTASIDDEGSATNLDVTMGRPDVVFSLRFRDGAQLRAARLAGRHLASVCAG